MPTTRGPTARKVAPDESREADASGLTSFSLFEGDGGDLSAVSPNVVGPNLTAFVGLGVRLSSLGVAASPIMEGSSMLSWTGGCSVPSTAREGGFAGWGRLVTKNPALKGGVNDVNIFNCSSWVINPTVNW